MAGEERWEEVVPDFAKHCSENSIFKASEKIINHTIVFRSVVEHLS